MHDSPSTLDRSHVRQSGRKTARLTCCSTSCSRNGRPLSGHMPGSVLQMKMGGFLATPSCLPKTMGQLESNDESLSLLSHLLRPGCTLLPYQTALMLKVCHPRPCPLRCAHDHTRREQKITSSKPSLDGINMEPSARSTNSVSPPQLSIHPPSTVISHMAFVCNSEAGFILRAPCWTPGPAP